MEALRADNRVEFIRLSGTEAGIEPALTHRVLHTPSCDRRNDLLGKLGTREDEQAAGLKPPAQRMEARWADNRVEFIRLTGTEAGLEPANQQRRQ
jgi:hypothetical protein